MSEYKRRNERPKTERKPVEKNKNGISIQVPRPEKLTWVKEKD
ncbi:hypothetical protein [Psychrobacillus sp. FSL K6-1415]